MKKEKSIKLYSAFFPFSGLLLADFSNVWWMTLLNLLVYLAVAFLVLRLSRAEDWRGLLPRVTARAFLTGLLADLVGALFRLGPLLAEMALRACGAERAAAYLAKYWSDFTWFQIWNTDWNKLGLPWTIASILVAGVFAFLFHYFVALKKLVPEKKLRRRLVIALAVFTAPYSWTNPAW